MTERRDIATRFQPGHAKLGGREKGARNKLGDQFLKNLRDDFATHGRAVIQHVRENDTSTYFTTVARLLPREVSASLQVQQKLPGNGSPEDWDTIRWMIDDTHRRSTRRWRRSGKRSRKRCRRAWRGERCRRSRRLRPYRSDAPSA